MSWFDAAFRLCHKRPHGTQRSASFTRARSPMWPRDQSEPATANVCGSANMHGYRGTRSAPAGTSGQRCSLLVQPRSPGSADYYDYYYYHYYRNEWWWYFLHGMLKDETGWRPPFPPTSHLAPTVSVVVSFVVVVLTTFNVLPQLCFLFIYFYLFLFFISAGECLPPCACHAKCKTLRS